MPPSVALFFMVFALLWSLYVFVNSINKMFFVLSWSKSVILISSFSYLLAISLISLKIKIRSHILNGLWAYPNGSLTLCSILWSASVNPWLVWSFKKYCWSPRLIATMLLRILFIYRMFDFFFCRRLIENCSRLLKACSPLMLPTDHGFTALVSNFPAFLTLLAEMF